MSQKTTTGPMVLGLCNEPENHVNYELVVGVEIHAQLKTNTKLFCGCPNRFGDTANTNTCPVCLGHPGTLPVLNRKVVELVTRAGLAFHCDIRPLSRFARKNYFYPDLPKGYQISQFELPICLGGTLEVKGADGNPKSIRLRRIHIEEDAGKLLHEGIRDGSLVDLNRAGTPLMEMVTEPNFAHSDEVLDFLVQLRQILRYLDVCDGNMEEGSLRCEPNISIRPRGAQELGVKIELKNLSSFKAAKKGIEYEFNRQVQALSRGEKLRQETRGWDEDKEQSYLMRVKEDSQDYRYFPDPDLPPLNVAVGEVENIRLSLPELPGAKKKRFHGEFGLSDTDAEVLCSEAAIAGYFEKLARDSGDPKVAANWVMGEVLRVLKTGGTIESFPIREDRLAELIKLVLQGKISNTIAKKIFEKMLTTPDKPQEIVEREGLAVVSDESAIAACLDEIMAANPAQVQQVLSGQEKVIGFLVGQAMKKMKGKADPAVLNRVLKEKLDFLKKSS